MAYGHYLTPIKSKLIGTVNYLQVYKIPFFKSDVFRHFRISPTRGKDILRRQNDRRHPEIETRGRKKLINPDQIQAMERILWTYGFQARRLTWQGLAKEAGISGVSSRTIERAMGRLWLPTFLPSLPGFWLPTYLPNYLPYRLPDFLGLISDPWIGTLGYRKCIACEKGWVSPDYADRRVKAAKLALFYRPRKENWRDIRWTDEAHFTIGSEGRIRIIRKPGERYCPDCIHHSRSSKQLDIQSEDRERFHVWAAVGYDFKSDLIFYDVPTNTNGKMSQQVYLDCILNGPVREWIERGDKFVMEEDGDSGHGGGNCAKNNPVRVWKEQHKLKHFFNTPGSPDLSPIENCWRAVKQYVRANYRLGSDLKALIIEGWKNISQDTINRWVDSMVVRMEQVIAGNGQMTGW